MLEGAVLIQNDLEGCRDEQYHHVPSQENKVLELTLGSNKNTKEIKLLSSVRRLYSMRKACEWVSETLRKVSGT